MPNILYRTRGNSSPGGNPRVYFTCHPDDFERYFDKICEDIFKPHDCAVYYTENMTDIIPDEDKPTDLGSMNLFVMPVTFRLLREPNRAMDDDFAYAKQEHIPVLPFMMESGIYVETDKERGLALSTKAAEAELPEAMERLFWMYSDGSGVTLDYRKAVIWAEKLADYHTWTLGEEHPDTLTSLHNLAFIYRELGDHRKALELKEKLYELQNRTLGKKIPPP